MMDVKQEVLEACPHTSCWSKYSEMGWAKICRKCNEQVSFKPHEKPNYNNYEIG